MIEFHTKVIFFGINMKNYIIFVACISTIGCAAVPVSNEMKSALANKHDISEEFINIENCTFYLAGQGRAYSGICGITDNKIIAHSGYDLSKVDSSKSISINFPSIKKVGYKTKIRLHQFQIVTDHEYLVVSITPNQITVDGELTKNWYMQLVDKNIEEFTPDSYVQQRIRMKVQYR